jgi:hypothetical protein
MNRFIALCAAAVMAGASMVAPVLATTETSSTNAVQHQADCLALLFTNPKAHAEQCGGPYTNLPAPVHGTTGFGPGCNVGSINEIGPDGRIVLVAGSLCCGSCCGSEISPNSWHKMPWDFRTPSLQPELVLVAC